MLFTCLSISRDESNSTPKTCTQLTETILCPPVFADRHHCPTTILFYCIDNCDNIMISVFIFIYLKVICTHRSFDLISIHLNSSNCVLFSFIISYCIKSTYLCVISINVVVQIVLLHGVGHWTTVAFGCFQTKDRTLENTICQLKVFTFSISYGCKLSSIP